MACAEFSDWSRHVLAVPVESFDKGGRFLGSNFLLLFFWVDFFEGNVDELPVVCLASLLLLLEILTQTTSEKLVVRKRKRISNI